MWLMPRFDMRVQARTLATLGRQDGTSGDFNNANGAHASYLKPSEGKENNLLDFL